MYPSFAATDFRPQVLAVCYVITLNLNGQFSSEPSEIKQWAQFPDMNMTDLSLNLLFPFIRTFSTTGHKTCKTKCSVPDAPVGEACCGGYCVIVCRNPGKLPVKSCYPLIAG